MLIPVDAGPLDVVVLAVRPSFLRCRRPAERKVFTFHPLRGRGIDGVVPGEILTVEDLAADDSGRSTTSVGNVIGVRVDAPALGLAPLKLENGGVWSPSEEYWGEEGDRLDACLLPILSAGPRPCLEMEQVVPGADWSLMDGPDPILESVALSRRGDRRRAAAVLQKCLLSDLRCLDAHAHLGNFAFHRDPARALRHYRVGAAIGELTVPTDTTAVLPWGMVDNRPFLRCLHGVAVSLWHLGRNQEVVEMLERLLWLCPSDNLGERLIIEAVRRGEPWGPGD